MKNEIFIVCFHNWGDNQYLNYHYTTREKAHKKALELRKDLYNLYEQNQNEEYVEIEHENKKKGFLDIN